jgi:predicted DNA-binding transcriptional regulator AlpA
MTKQELLRLPVAVDLVTAARAFGISKSHGYELVQRGEFPVPVIRLGKRMCVSRGALLSALDVTDEDDQRAVA